MAQEREFVEGVLSLLQSHDMGAHVTEIQNGWLEAGLPSTPSRDSDLSQQQVWIVVEVLECLVCELQSLAFMRSSWPSALFVPLQGSRSAAEPVVVAQDNVPVNDQDAASVLAGLVRTIREQVERPDLSQ